jgi:hypothetical protein
VGTDLSQKLRGEEWLYHLLEGGLEREPLVLSPRMSALTAIPYPQGLELSLVCRCRSGWMCSSRSGWVHRLTLTVTGRVARASISSATALNF